MRGRPACGTAAVVLACLLAGAFASNAREEGQNPSPAETAAPLPDSSKLDLHEGDILKSLNNLSDELKAEEADHDKSHKEIKSMLRGMEDFKADEGTAHKPSAKGHGSSHHSHHSAKSHHEEHAGTDDNGGASHRDHHRKEHARHSQRAGDKKASAAEETLLSEDEEGSSEALAEKTRKTLVDSFIHVDKLPVAIAKQLASNSDIVRLATKLEMLNSQRTRLEAHHKATAHIDNEGVSTSLRLKTIVESTLRAVYAAEEGDDENGGDDSDSDSNSGDDDGGDSDTAKGQDFDDIRAKAESSDDSAPSDSGPASDSDADSAPQQSSDAEPNEEQDGPGGSMPPAEAGEQEEAGAPPTQEDDDMGESSAAGDDGVTGDAEADQAGPGEVSGEGGHNVAPPPHVQIGIPPQYAHSKPPDRELPMTNGGSDNDGGADGSSDDDSDSDDGADLKDLGTSANKRGGNKAAKKANKMVSKLSRGGGAEKLSKAQDVSMNEATASHAAAADPADLSDPTDLRRSVTTVVEVNKGSKAGKDTKQKLSKMSDDTNGEDTDETDSGVAAPPVPTNGGGDDLSDFESQLKSAFSGLTAGVAGLQVPGKVGPDSGHIASMVQASLHVDDAQALDSTIQKTVQQQMDSLGLTTLDQ